jgi:hypothetical protein
MLIAIRSMAMRGLVLCAQCADGDSLVLLMLLLASLTGWHVSDRREFVPSRRRSRGLVCHRLYPYSLYLLRSRSQ